MKNPSDTFDDLEALQQKLAGLGESSLRKTYYPQLQQRLEELERFKAFIDHSNDVIFLVEVPTGRIIDLNESASSRMGWTREEFLGLSLFDLSNLESCPDAGELLRSPLDQARKQALTVTELYQKEGGRFYAEVTLNRMSFHDRTYVLAVVRDITDRRHLEQQLLQSQKMEAIGQLAGGVAHDFNNILMVIMGYCNMLKSDSGLDPQHMEKVEHILQASDKAAQLTASLLAFGRKQVMKTQTTNLNDIILHVQQFLVRIIGEDIQLNSVIKQPSLMVSVDTGQIEQVLMNLATNARDSMPKGGRLTIETGQQEIDELFVKANAFGVPGRYAVISVSDTGIGMDEKTRERIFEPFFTTKERGKGTGLGMAIVYGIIKQHNGSIHVYSEPNVGTTFKIFLPLAAVAVAPEEGPVDAVAPRGGTETILVAEDEAALRTMIESILTGFGYRVVLARDGQEAVEKFAAERGKIDLILMDMIMPRMSGKEASDAIRSLDPKARLIYTSGYTMDIIQSRDLLQDGTELIMKPVHPVDLLKKVREILDR